MRVALSRKPFARKLIHFSDEELDKHLDPPTTIRSSVCCLTNDVAYCSKSGEHAALTLTKTSEASRRSPGVYSRWLILSSRTRRIRSARRATSGTTRMVVPASGRVHGNMNSMLLPAPVGRIAATCSRQSMMVDSACSCSLVLHWSRLDRIVVSSWSIKQVSTKVNAACKCLCRSVW